MVIFHSYVSLPEGISKSGKSWMVHENWDSSSWIMKDYDNSWFVSVASFRVFFSFVYARLVPVT